jgi:hypothetical protein
LILNAVVVEAAPLTSKPAHWRGRYFGGSALKKTEYGSQRSELTADAVVVEAASRRSSPEENRRVARRETLKTDG